MRQIPKSGQPGLTLLTGRDGFYVKAWRDSGAVWLSAGHGSVVGGLFGEWSDSESDRDMQNRARRMLARARRPMTFQR